MKRAILYIVALSVLIASPAIAEMHLYNPGVRVISDAYGHTNYSWKCNVSSSESPRKAYIHVIFLDSQGFQIHFTNDIVTINSGVNDVSGMGMCSSAIWEQVKEYRISIK